MLLCLSAKTLNSLFFALYSKKFHLCNTIICWRQIMVICGNNDKMYSAITSANIIHILLNIYQSQGLGFVYRHYKVEATHNQR